MMRNISAIFVTLSDYTHIAYLLCSLRQRSLHVNTWKKTACNNFSSWESKSDSHISVCCGKSLQLNTAILRVFSRSASLTPMQFLRDHY